MTSKLQEKTNSYQRVWAEIDLDAIWENMIHMKENIAPETKILAVIKTDGYGHGGVPIARMLEDVDFMFGYAAATYEEAHVLREAGVKKPILILGYTFPYCYEEMIREEIRPAVYRRDTVEELAEAAAKAGKKAKVHIKVDTGMGRIGITPDDEGLDFVKFVMNIPDWKWKVSLPTLQNRMKRIRLLPTISWNCFRILLIEYSWNWDWRFR